MCKLFGWILFWSIVHVICTREVYDIPAQFVLGVINEGILPISWFLYTYCFLMIIAYPLHRLKERYPRLFMVLTVLLLFGMVLTNWETMIHSVVQALWLPLYATYFMCGMILQGNVTKIMDKLHVYGIVVIFIGSLGVYAWQVKNAPNGLLPYDYYGKWYYVLWILSFFVMLCNIKIVNLNWQGFISRVASNTFVVYMGHLPLLLYMTGKYPLTGTGMALFFIIAFFTILELVAEVFRKMPLLRKLV